MSTQHKLTAGSTILERKSWPIKCYRLGNEPSDDLSAVTTPEERLEMMWELAVEAWTLAGRPLPQYERSETPVRLARRNNTPAQGAH